MQLGTTIVYVTHDQTEALTLADKIVCMSDGRIQQIGNSLEIYNKPKNTFVGGFLGSPAMNFINAEIIDNSISFNGSNFPLNSQQVEKLKNKTSVIVGIRPEKFNQQDSNFNFRVKINISEMLGNEQLAYFKINDCDCAATLQANYELKENIELKFNTDDILFFDVDTKQLI